MKRRGQILLNTMMVLTVVGICIIIGILLFKQSAVPKLQTGPPGQKGDSVTKEELDLAVQHYFTNNPVDIPDVVVSQSDIARAVAEYMTINPVKNGVDGHSVVGPKGADGKSCTVEQIETGAAILCQDGTSALINNGVDGKTPQLRCNENRNRWEVRYVNEENWAILNNKVTPCKAGV